MSRRYSRETKLKQAYQLGKEDALTKLAQNPEWWSEVLMKNPVFYTNILKEKPKYIPKFIWKKIFNLVIKK